MNKSVDAEHSGLVERAADWFGRRELGLSRAEELEFARWLDADPRHRRIYRQFDRTWDFFAGLERTTKENSAEASATIASDASTSVRAGRSHVMWWSVTLAAAAAIAFVFAVRRAPVTEAPFERQASTDTTGIRKMTLPDGSEVSLNADSAVDVQFTPDSRRVALRRGEAHFTVAKNPARPFIVSAGGVAVRAVGTAFNVKLESASVDVLVTEGKVAIGTGSTQANEAASATSTGSRGPARAETMSPPIVAAGHRAIVKRPGVAPDDAITITAVSPGEIEHAVQWRARQLEFDMTPLSEAVAQFNRYNQHQLVIGDAELGRRPFGGSFRVENYDAFVSVLETNFGVVAERLSDRTILRRRRE